ncbi:MAG: class E sortase [Acidimicrobiales bacterium]
MARQAGTELLERAPDEAPAPTPARVPLLARVLGGVGRTLITAGVLILLFVAYQLWGTGIRTSQAQNRLDDDFAEQLEQAQGGVIGEPQTPETTPTTGRDPVIVASDLAPELLPQAGAVAGRMQIPRLGSFDWYFVEGVSVDDLKQGPGHYPQTPLPGQAGNSGIAGHRTTYGAPFANIDQLQPGDELAVTTVQGTFTYMVRGQEIVAPSAIEVLDDGHWTKPDGTPVANTLTLTACHPKYSAAQRIIVWAELVGNPAPATPRLESPVRSLDNSGDRASKWPAVLWALLCALIWLMAWAVGKKWRRAKWPAYGIFILPFLVALFFFFENFSRLLPSNY